MNVALAHYCGITEPICVINLGESVSSVMIPSRELTATNHIQVNFGRGLVYYISFQAEEGCMNCHQLMFKTTLYFGSTRVHLGNKLYVHKVDTDYNKAHGNCSILAAIVEPDIGLVTGGTKTIQNGSGAFTVTLHPLSKGDHRRCRTGCR